MSPIEDYEGHSNLEYFESLTRKLEQELRGLREKEEILEELVNEKQAEIEGLKDNIFEIDGRNTKAIVLEIPEKLKSIIHQYLIYFKEYVIQVKGKEIKFDIQSISEGLRITTNNDKEILEKLDDWFSEYIGLIEQNFENLNLKYEKKMPSDELVNKTINHLYEQVNHLKNSLRIKGAKINLLKEENQFLKTISLNLTTSQKLLGESDKNRSPLSEIAELKKQIAKGELLNVIEKLMIRAEQRKSKKEYNHLIMLYQEITRLNVEIRLGKISFEQQSIIVNRITHSLLQIMDE